MPVFEYQAVNNQGQAVKGTMFSSSLTTAADELARRGFTVQNVMAVESANDPIPADFQAAGAGDTYRTPPPAEARPAIMTQVVGQIFKVPLSSLLFFFQQLSTMLAAGVGIVQSLDTLSRQTPNGVLGRVIAEMSEHVRAGRPLTAGMERYPDVFSPLMISLVRTGEEGGLVDESLKQVANYIEREIALRNLIRRATLYPKVVIGASIAIILLTNIILGAIGSSDQLSSPLTTPATWIVLGPFIAGLYLFVKLGLPQPGVKQQFDSFVLGLPVLGVTIHEFAMSKFGRALAALYRGGVPLGKSVRLAADACGSGLIRDRIYPSAQAIEEGGGIADSFTRTAAFSPLVLDMVRTGETTGRVDDMLDKLANFYEDDAQTRANQMAIILGVVCLGVVAIYVAYVVITFYAGYFGKLGAAASG